MPQETFSKGAATPNNELYSFVNSALQDNPLLKQHDSRSSLPSFLKKRGASLGQQENDSKNSLATTTAENLGQFTGVDNRFPTKISVFNPKNATLDIQKNHSLPLFENR